MSWSLDARIPIACLTEAELPARMAGAAARPALLLPEGMAVTAEGAPLARFPAAPQTHPIACSCCAGRSAMATALDLLFQARVRGTSPWFDRVLAILPEPDMRAELEATLQNDALTRARFRAG